MTTATVLAIGVALAFATLYGHLVWRLDIQTRRGDQEVTRRKAIAAENKRLKQVARNQEAECVRLAEVVRESEAAYIRLQESLTVGDWVRVPTNKELHEGVWP